MNPTEPTADLRTLAYDAAPVAMHAWCPQGTVVAVSDAWLTRFGWSRSQVVNRPLGDFMPVTRPALAAEALPSIGGPAAIPRSRACRIVCGDGSLAHVTLLERILLDKDAAGIRGIAVVTDAPADGPGRERLREDDVFLDRVGRLAGVGAWELDLSAETVRWSAETCRIHEVEVHHRPELAEAMRYYAPEAQGAIARAVADCSQRGIPFDLELPLVTAKGRRIWVRAQGEAEYAGDRPVRLFGALKDITARRAADEALAASRHAVEESERLLRTVVDNLPALVALVGRDERYRFCNRAYETWYGVAPERVVGRTVREIVGEADYERIRGCLAQVLAGTPVTAERWVSTVSGRRWGHVTLQPHRGAAGDVDGYYVLLQDRTEAYEAQLAREENERRIRTIMENVPAMIGYWTANGDCLFGNRLHDEWLARRATDADEAATGNSLSQQADGLTQTIVSCVREGSRASFNRAIRDGHGVARTLNLTVIADRTSGRVQGAYIFGTDVTELDRRVEERTRQLRALAVELSLAEQRERRTIARELHDGLGQLLAVAQVKLSTLPAGCDRAADVKQVAELLAEASRSLRSMTFQLSPPILEELGLAPALDWLAEELSRHYGLGVRVDHDGKPIPLGPVLSGIVFTAVRELLINVAKHARTDRAVVSLASRGADLVVSVADSGCGFDVSKVTTALPPPGFGLVNVRERLNHLGGSVSFASFPGRGTTVTLVAPVRSAGPPEHDGPPRGAPSARASSP